MRHSLPVLALTCLCLGVVSCTAELAPSTQANSPNIAVTPADARADANLKEPKVTSIDSTTDRDSRIPLINREAPEKFETATFALG